MWVKVYVFLFISSLSLFNHFFPFSPLTYPPPASSHRPFPFASRASCLISLRLPPIILLLPRVGFLHFPLWLMLPSSSLSPSLHNSRIRWAGVCVCVCFSVSFSDCYHNFLVLHILTGSDQTPPRLLSYAFLSPPFLPFPLPPVSLIFVSQSPFIMIIHSRSYR